MSQRAPALVAAGQVCLVVFLGVCVALHPGLVVKRDEGGVSNYGVHVVTFVPYSLAFALDAVLIARGARLVADARLRRYLELVAALLGATLVTTYAYTRSLALKDLHFVVGAALVLAECAAAPWLARAWARAAPAAICVALTGAGLAACALATSGAWHVLFAGQVLVAAGFTPLVVAATRSRA